MGNFEARVKITDEARKRVRALTFGEPVTNVCAGELNPFRHAFFVKLRGDYVQVTDKKGRFTSFEREVIYPGHLSIEVSRQLFEPFWQAQYGEPLSDSQANKP